jgi:hypothetical protein
MNKAVISTQASETEIKTKDTHTLIRVGPKVLMDTGTDMENSIGKKLIKSLCQKLVFTDKNNKESLNKMRIFAIICKVYLVNAKPNPLV